MTGSLFKSAMLLLALTLLSGGLAGAAPSKVWVANSGADNATCGPITSPCATFQRAHDNVAAGGEIAVLTPGDFAGSGIPKLLITKSVSIVNDGAGEASILSTLAVPMVIQAGAGDVVSLRGLIIDGQVTTEIGAQFVFGSALHVQNCVFRNFESSFAIAILYQPRGNSQLFVSDTLIFNNGSGADSGGIVVQPLSAGSARVVLDRVRLENNVVGLLVDGTQTTADGAHVVVRDSVMSGNASDGIRAFTAPGQKPAFIVVERTSLVNNAGNGILADGPGATVLVSDSTIARNGAGIGTANGGQLISYGNNTNNNNIGPEGTPTGFYGLF